MVAMPILRCGSCWCVENGESIKVLVDKWILNYPSNRVLHPVYEGVEDWRVSDLIDLDLHGWRRDTIMTIFNREDAEAICKIPLSHRRVSDVVVWLHNKEGVYTIRSGYHVDRKVLREWAVSSTGSGQELWKKLWRVRVPNKLKVFAWRACHEILPTRVNLAKRKIIRENLCLFSRMELFVVQAWTLWNQRNTLVHGRKMKNPYWLNRRASNYLEEYRKAQEQLAVSNTTSSGHHWKPPPQTVYKLNFDAAVFTEQQSSGIGARI
ncbi:uncharacterized protein LOC142616054 [Castanea sativa]|uniref:uncharacterized protein LOC142616054 n=1 Tax=Castanea sativa TaxID=21020 RepID=UPI003F64B909